jgi:hypothetical protein
VPANSGSLAWQFTSVVESSARQLTATEVADARDLAQQLVEAHPDDLPRIAVALTGRYNQLVRAVAARLSLSEFVIKEIVGGFTAYVDYVLLTGEGGFDMRTTTPLFLTSADCEAPVDGARTIALDTGHDDLLRDPEVHKLVTDLLRGKLPW